MATAIDTLDGRLYAALREAQASEAFQALLSRPEHAQEHTMMANEIARLALETSAWSRRVSAPTTDEAQRLLSMIQTCLAWPVLDGTARGALENASRCASALLDELR